MLLTSGTRWELTFPVNFMLPPTFTSAPRPRVPAIVAVLVTLRVVAVKSPRAEIDQLPDVTAKVPAEEMLWPPAITSPPPSLMVKVPF